MDTGSVALTRGCAESRHATDTGSVAFPATTFARAR